ncbi:MAG TPA: hypothetical protein VIL43_07295 [Burkholderiales bacterium]
MHTILKGDRVRTHTAAAVLRRIDDETHSRLQRYADADAETIAYRLDKLDREWDTDRVIELEAAATGLAGLALGVLVRPAFLALPALVGGSLLAYALTGWYPLLPVLRRLGVRTPREIARERYALKALRGDFAQLDEATGTHAAPPEPASESMVGSSERRR